MQNLMMIFLTTPTIERIALLLTSLLIFGIPACITLSASFYKLRQLRNKPNSAKKRSDQLAYLAIIGGWILNFIYFTPILIDDLKGDKEYEPTLQSTCTDGTRQPDRYNDSRPTDGSIRQPNIYNDFHPTDGVYGNPTDTMTPAQRMEYFDQYYEDYLSDPEDEMAFPPEIFDDNMEWDPADESTFPPDITIDDL